MLNLACLLLVLSAPAMDTGNAVSDTPFLQEYREAYPVSGQEDAANDVRAVAVDAVGAIWAATGAGLYVLRQDTLTWQAMLPKAAAGPVFDVTAGADGVIWAGAWNGVWRATGGEIAQETDVTEPIAALCVHGERVAAAGPKGLWVRGNGVWARQDLPCARSIRAMLWDDADNLWIATGMGLFRHTASGSRLYQLETDILSADLHGLAVAPDGALWVAGLGGITLFREGRRAGHFTPKEGLPNALALAVASGSDGRMWVGTPLGVTRWDGKKWSLRHSQRWLLNDEVRDVAFGADGTAWVATAGGVSAIRQRPMTLADKAAYFLEVCRARHFRAPGLVEKCRLAKAGDLSTWEPEDDDNDGQYTAMYMVAESYRYAATKDPGALANAREAFDALYFLQAVTDTPGFIARTVVPPEWKRMHDGNRTFTAQESAAALVEDPRFKPVEVRWRKSKDGKWLWKGDTSSDEITGHFFGWARYYDLAADEADKARVRDVTRRVMDGIIDSGYVLKDIDGTHTCWGVWAPERLNNDPDWRAERGINALEILSYLKATYHITGDERYQREYLALLHEHGYADNVRKAKTYEPSWRTHIDDELLIMSYPALILYETDPVLLALYRESLERWYEGSRPEQNPLFDFFYGALTGKNPQPEISAFTLRDVPLDLINWTVDNAPREEVRLQRAPILEVIQTDRLLPPSERGTIRWDKNPWEPTQGDGGKTEWAPTFWLLPYWLGRYQGFIQPAT